MNDDQLKVEVDWCLARIEEKLASMDPFSRPAREAAKVHQILKSSKAPVIKKRQAMRNMFGDYREKMKAAEKKQLAAMKKSKLVAVKESPSKSKFIRLGTGADQARNASDIAVSTAADSLQQLSVDTSNGPATDVQTTQTTVAQPVENGSAALSDSSETTSGGDFKFNFDGSEGATETDSSGKAAASSSADGAQSANYFAMKPSNEEFRFNFTPDDCSVDT